LHAKASLPPCAPGKTRFNDFFIFAGRFGPGLPRVSDGSLLFLLHLISKLRDVKEGGSRIGIILNGSPLFTGGAGSGESEIRRHILESDLLEAIVALPTDMFYNTGISTYVWILSNRKVEDRKGLVQLIDASSFWLKMRKSLGNKRKEMSGEHIATVTKLFGDFVEASLVTVLDTDGKEASRQVLMDGETLPKAPNGGKVKSVPVSRIFRNEDFGGCSYKGCPGIELQIVHVGAWVDGPEGSVDIKWICVERPCKALC
jgi:type I restriction enzyme M protein